MGKSLAILLASESERAAAPAAGAGGGGYAGGAASGKTKALQDMVGRLGFEYQLHADKFDPAFEVA